MLADVKTHYDMLIYEGNDPVQDAAPLKEYMNKWDGYKFIQSLELTKDKTVLEIGIGTGRLALKVAPQCKTLYGIDISPRTIERAKENLKEQKNVTLICDDFLAYDFSEKFDVIYSSLTFMHIENKQAVINKVSSLLNKDGIFVLSIDKNQSEYIDMNTRKIKIFPDIPDKKGRIWYEADVDYESGHRNTKRIVFSNDGLIFITYDHYQTFIEIR